MARIASAGSLVLGNRAQLYGLPTGPVVPQVWSPTEKQAGIALSEAGGRRAQTSTFSAGINAVDVRSAGILQFEFDHLSAPNGNVSMGVTSSNITFNTAMQGSAGSAYIRNGFIGRGTATSEQTVTALATNDVVGCVVDFTAQTITYYKNGVQLGVPSSTSLMTAALKIKAYAQSTASFALRLRLNGFTFPIAGATEWTPP